MNGENAAPQTATADENRRFVRRQVERIIDSGEGDRREVIVRVLGRDAEERLLADTAARAISQRNMSLSARDTLPRDRTPGKRSAAPQDQDFPRDNRGVSAQIPHDRLARHEVEALRDYAYEELKPLSADARVSNYMPPTLAGVDAEPVRGFWTSKALLVDISTDDLIKLPEIEQIRAVHANRRIRVPQLMVTRNMPIAVRENKISSWGLDKIGALSTWGAYNARGRGIKVGVLDTGVDAGHPDLAGKIKGWVEFDHEGRKVPGSKPHDTDKHGTHCCGIIAGGDSSGQWIGVAPEAELYVALVLDGHHGGTDAQILAGLDWLVDQRVHVISMSLGGFMIDPEMPSTYTEAMLTCLRAGIPVVTAIGNEGSQTTGSPGNDIFAFSVGATDYLDHAAGFSGGRTQIIQRSSYIPAEALPLPYSKPEVSAPGVAIQSSVPNGSWEALNGTSMATPHVAGAMALLLSATKILESTSPSERGFLLQDIITGSVEELGESGQNHRFGFGRIDVLRAIGFAKELGY